ncbi:MAG: hypothetical protein B7733_01575 [Myxococcales bacterium FL481]|nr:MAG: hypothetical protein B7733_01575 [Myxococcales bacterium FL481]
METRPVSLTEVRTSVPLPYNLVGADGRVVLREGEIVRRYEVLLLRSLGVQCLYRGDSPAETEAVRLEHNIADVRPSEVAPGEQLARAVHGRTGAMLLGRGAELTHEYLIRLSQLGIEEVCVHRGHRPRPEIEQFKVARKRLATRLGANDQQVADFAPWETECFVRAWLDVGQRYGQTKFKATAPELSAGLSTRGDLVWSMPLCGEPHRVLVFTMQPPLAVALASNALGVGAADVDEASQQEVLTGLIAMFAADAEAMMDKAGSPVRLGSPQLARGEGIVASMPGQVRLLVLPLRAKAGWMRISLTIDGCELAPAGDDSGDADASDETETSAGESAPASGGEPLPMAGSSTGSGSSRHDAA